MRHVLQLFLSYIFNLESNWNIYCGTDVKRWSLKIFLDIRSYKNEMWNLIYENSKTIYYKHIALHRVLTFLKRIFLWKYTLDILIIRRTRRSFYMQTCSWSNKETSKLKKWYLRDIFIMFKASITQYCITRPERINVRYSHAIVKYIRKIPLSTLLHKRLNKSL